MLQPPAHIVRAFEEAMVQVYVRARNEAQYLPARFLQMLREHGGVETARRLLPQMSEGLVKLWERNRLDLTVAYVILRPPWQVLFNEEERSIARTRLRDRGMEV